MGDDLRALLFGESDPKSSVGSGIWGNTISEDEDLFSEARSPKFQVSSKKISDVVREIDSGHSSDPVNISSLSNSLESIKLLSEVDTEGTIRLQAAISVNDENDENDLNDLNDPLLNPLCVYSVEKNQSSHIPDEILPTTIIETKKEEKTTKAQLFEVCIVVGTPPRKSVSPNIVTKSLDPQILFKYPKKTHLPLKKIASFCFPNGIKAKRVAKNSTDLSEMFYGQQYLHNASSSFIFLLTGNEGKPLYGMCVQKDEPVEELPEFMGSPSTTEQRVTIDKYITVAPRVYCIISQYPFFSLHYDVLYGIVAHEKLLRMSREFTEETRLDLIVNHEVLKILTSYYESTAPLPGESFFLPMPYEHKDLSFVNPPKNSTAIIKARWCFVTLFRVLSLSSILRILAAVYQETQIVFVSKNLGILSSVILSIIPMIRPLEWQGLLVPILPQDLKETLNAPVPYICGVVDLSSVQVRQLTKNQAMIVHLDVDALRLPRDFAELPEIRKLKEKLKEHHNFIFNSDQSVDNPYFTNYEFSTISESIFTAFHSYGTWLVNNICKNFRHLGPNQFAERDAAKSDFIAKIGQNNLLFVKAFLDSQCFNNYLEHFIQNNNKE